MLKISLLGSLQVTVGEMPAEFRTDALRVLLAYLASHQGTPQRRDTLAGLLSPDRPDKEALTYLRNRLTRLRRTLQDNQATPPWFDTDRKQIALRLGDDIQIDVTQFERHLTTVENHAHRQLAGCPTCLTHLQTAVDLVRGELLAGLNFPSDTWESWLMGQREYVGQRALEAMTLLREARVARGEWEAVLAVAQRQLTIEPWLEAAHRAVMVAFYCLGDRNGALGWYEKCRQILDHELGVEPEPETDTLYQQILDRTLVVSDGIPTLHNLPEQTSRFFGREAEQTQLLQRLVDPNYRLITLVGAGGIGKTRLAIEVGKQVKASFPDGVWFVSLAGQQRDAEQIKIAIGEAAGLGQGDKQLTGEQVIAILRDKRMLLIFDNSETVVDDIAFIPQWLKRAPHVAILATSREPLNFQAETVVMVDKLPIGNTEMDVAEKMFAERGQMARADFSVSTENLPQVRHICQLVDGSPLGITLAATWVRRRSLAQIIDSIGQSLDFLSTRLRDVDPRHRSMRAVFETSWGLLEAEEQAILPALSIFPTTFSAEAALAVAGATLFDLDALCEKSLLQQEQEGERYALHGLVRQFAGEKLGDGREEVERGFVGWFYEYAGINQNTYPQLQPEWHNFLESIRKAHALQAWQMVLDFVAVLDEPWFRQIRFNDMREGLILAAKAANMLQDQPALAQALLRLGEIEIEQDNYTPANAHLTDALHQFMRLEDSLGIAHSKYLIGRIHLEQAQDDQAVALLTESKRIFENEADWLGVAQNLNLLALRQTKETQDFHKAQLYLEKSVALQQALPPSARYIETLRHLARVKGLLKAYADAENDLIEAARMSRQQNNIGEYAAVLFERLLLCKKREQYDKALAFGYESLELFRKLGSLRNEAMIKTQLGRLHQAQQNHLEGLVLLKEGLQIFCELENMYEQAYSYYYLYKLYAEINDPEQSENAKEQAYRLNLKLHDSRLTKWLK